MHAELGGEVDEIFIADFGNVFENACIQFLVFMNGDLSNSSRIRRMHRSITAHLFKVMSSGCIGIDNFLSGCMKFRIQAQVEL